MTRLSGGGPSKSNRLELVSIYKAEPNSLMDVQVGGKSNILFGCISKKGNPSSSHAYVTYAFVAVNRKKMISLPNRDRKNIIYNGFIRNTSTKARHKRWRIQSTPRLSPSYHHHLRLPLRPPRHPAVATRRRRARRTHLNSFSVADSNLLSFIHPCHRSLQSFLPKFPT